MSDRFGNNVDGEIWIDQVVQYGPKDGSQKPRPPLKTVTEWSLAYADGSINEESIYTRMDTAMGDLEYLRKTLRDYGVPEEYWPALVERTVETIAGSWRILDV